MQKVCLVFIFNHRYDGNIEKLEKIYESRFSEIRYIVPFYNERDSEKIISVYESSYYFEGYFIQALDKLKRLDVDFFLFVADDLILNPLIDEGNFLEFFGLKGSKKCYINEIDMLNTGGGIGWQHSMYSSLPFFSKGVLWQRELPSFDTAINRFTKFFGTPYKEKYDEQFFYTGCDIEETNALIQTFYDNNGNSFDIPYPMAKGYSDVLIVKKDDLCEFSKVCGIFSALDVFVEIAVPTSIVLLFDRDEVSSLAETDYTAKLLWYDYEYFSKVAGAYGHDFNIFYDDWKKEWLYIHPIKLSEWNIK